MKRPNIIFILADDMGFGDVGCNNPDSKIPTPNMDELARRGMRFTDAHSPSAVCTPSRYAILTGRYCWRSSLEHGVLYGYEPPLIEPDRLTVASMLKKVGYQTACIGKWHVGLGFSTKPGRSVDFNRPLPWSDAKRSEEESIDFTQSLTGGPTELGFDYFFGTSGCCTAQPPYGFIENDRFIDPPSVYRDKPRFTGRPGMTSPSWDDKMPDPIIAGKAVEYIEKCAKSDSPFFLYLSTNSPHEPCLTEVVPEFARGQSQAGPRGDMVWLVDWVVGQVMEALDRTGQADNTLIMVTSDNGALPGDRKPGPPGVETVATHYNTHGHKSCGDWRGYKAHIWEGGHREPLLARWPGRIKPGTNCDQMVGLVDFLATCAAINGYDLPVGVAQDSASLLPAMLGEPIVKPIHTELIHHSVNGVFSIRQGDWKCIFDTRSSGGWPPPRDGMPVPGSPGQLYNLKNDPAEQTNLWDGQPERVESLRARLMEIRGE